MLDMIAIMMDGSRDQRTRLLTGKQDRPQPFDIVRRFSLFLLTAFASGCAFSHAPAALTTVLAATDNSQTDSLVSEATGPSGEASLDQALVVRSNERVAELKSRGGECATYGSVLETSLQAGRVTVRDYMWRVGGRLVSGEARPDGAIVVARHIDPLNVGARTIDDIVRTLEHEAAHVAFRITNGRDSDDANALVQTCSRVGP